MSYLYILIGFLIYTLLVFTVARITTLRANNESYFTGNRNSPWYVVSYGMIGASLSGVTFMSVPGLVQAEQFTYMVMVFGFFAGYIVIGLILLPLYYRLNLTSIYTYLENRFGIYSYKTGSFYFILSRLIGSSFRLFLVANVLQLFVFDYLGVPFFATVALFIVFILLYSFQGGIKTIVWTDTLQTTIMLSSVVITIIIIGSELNLSIGELWREAVNQGYTQFFITDINNPRFYLKQFFSGMFITIVMTGLDQDMMQKNLSCRSLHDARKNMFTFGFILLPVNLLFLFLGAALWIFANNNGIDPGQTSDELFPNVVFGHLNLIVGLTFIFGLISAAYSSADGTLTALTTAFCVDFLGIKRKPHFTESKIKKIRTITHIAFSIIMLLIIISYRTINDTAIISQLFTLAGYTYGPLLGLFAFGLFTRYKIIDKWAPLVCILSPAISYIISSNSEQWLWGYKFGFEILILNGLFTFAGLLILSRKNR